MTAPAPQSQPDIACDPKYLHAPLATGHVSEIATLQARVEELTKALEPFAEIAKELVPTLTDDDKNTMAWAVPTVGQLREALRAVAMPLEQSGSGK